MTFLIKCRELNCMETKVNIVHLPYFVINYSKVKLTKTTEICTRCT
jgi:hypothetical protein